jgi:hypothetical protein
MAHEEQEDCSLQPPDPANRVHWLSLAGYIAGGDGLSDDEALELAHGAASPDLSKEEAHALLASAAAGPLSDEACDAVATDDLAHRVNCLLELAQAIAIDGMSAAEWLRYCEVSGRVLGAQRVDAEDCTADPVDEEARTGGSNCPRYAVVLDVQVDGAPAHVDHDRSVARARGR